MLLKSIQFVIIDMVSVVVCVRQKGDIETSEKKKNSADRNLKKRKREQERVIIGLIIRGESVENF